MTKLSYNISLAFAVLLIAAGVSMINVPAALVTTGVVVLALTIFNVTVVGKS